MNLSESAEYKALSAEQKAIIDKYDAMDPGIYAMQTSADRYFFSTFAFDVYRPYALAQIKRYHKETDANKAQLVTDVLGTAGEAKPTKDAGGQQIASTVALHKAIAIWSSTVSGGNKVIRGKIATAKKMLTDLSVDAFQTEAPFMDTVDVVTSENDGLRQVLSVLKESPTFTAPRTGNSTKILRGLMMDSTDVVAQEQFYEYKPIPSGGAWVKQYAIHDGKSGYLTDGQILDKATLEHNTNI